MSQAIEKKKPITVLADYLQKRKGAMADVMAAGMDIERLTKLAIAAASRTPNLLQCTPESIYAAMHTSVALGLEPAGPFGEAYLVPYGREATLVVGYQGLVKLARNSGQVAKLYARVAYENDAIEIEQGLEESFTHKPNLRGERGAPVMVYAVAHLVDGGCQFEWMTVSDINKIRDRSKAAKSGPWVTDWEEMAKKTVFKRLAKWLPKSTTKEGLAFAEAVDEDNNPRHYVDIDVSTPQAAPEAGKRALDKVRPIAVVETAPSAAEPPHDPGTGEASGDALELSFNARFVIKCIQDGNINKAREWQTKNEAGGASDAENAYTRAQLEAAESKVQ